MKLLLTSNGLSNDSIAKALTELVGKDPKDTKVAFIPTAANAGRDSKEWLINDLYRIQQTGYYVDIVELTATKPEDLEKILEPFDVIFVGGGNTFYLSYWMQKSGLFELLPKMLKTKVYAGISAGSMIAGKSLVLSSQAINNPESFEDEHYDLLGPKDESAGDVLNLIDIIFRPHLNARYFSLVNKAELATRAEDLKYPVYALDDNSALKIVDGNIEVISEGDWLKFN